MPTANENGNTEVTWWTEENEDRRAEIVADVAGRIWRDQAATREGMLRSARMYGSLPMMGLSPRLYRQRSMARGRRLSLNLIKSAVNTYVAMVTEDRPKITFGTSGADDSVQRRAKLNEKFVDGTCYDQGLHIQAYQVVRDSALFSFGIVKFFKDESDAENPRVGIERTLPWEWLFDDQESADGNPPNGYHVKFRDKRAVAKEYPALKDKIMLASAGGFDEMGETFEQVNLVEWCVQIEAWHLPEDTKTPGRRTIVVVGVDEPLFDGEYTWHRLPCEWLHRERPIQGVHGESLADELAPLQVEISRLLVSAQRSQMYAPGHWLIEQNSQINTNQIDDVTCSIIRYAGSPPTYHAPPPVPPGNLEHVDRLWAKGFESIGVPQMLAGGQKPAGLNSGEAQRVYAAVTTKRFKPNYAEYQDWYLRVAQQIIHLGAEIAKDHPDFTIRTPGKMMAAVRWADMHLRESEYILQLAPTNALADDPASREARVQEYLTSGLIPDPMTGRRLLANPDIEALNLTDDASYNLTQDIVTMILEQGKLFKPEPYMNLAESLKLVQFAYLKARMVTMPDYEAKMDMFRTWIDLCADMMEDQAAKAAAKQAAQQAAMGPQPQQGAPAPGGMPLANHVQADMQRMSAHNAAQNLMGA